MNRPLPAWQRILATLGSLKLTVIGLILLTVLTVWGTLYQADFGLYRAQERFYSSWFFLGGGWLPFPGAQTVMVLLFVNLAASLIFLSLIGRQRFGLLVTHGGLVLMLAAGAVTFYYGSESQLTLGEGEGTNVAAAYHDWEIAAWPGTDGMADREISAIDIAGLKSGDAVRLDALNLDLVVEDVHANSTPSADTQAKDQPVSGANWTTLTGQRPDKEPQRDRPGTILQVRTADGEEIRILLWGGDNRPVFWTSGTSSYVFMLRLKRVPLPAMIHLIDFTKEFHPGSQIAKSFSSQVTLEDGDVERQVLISMNKPLRYKGFTFYQSSYRDLPGGRETSTLAVVKNYGRLMPYIATAATVIGMCLHFTGILITRLNRKSSPIKRGA